MLVRAALTTAYELGKTITYKQLSAAIDGGVPRNSHTGDALLDIYEECLDEGKFPIPALVVTEKAGMPSHGFFRAVEDRHSMKFLDDNHRKAYWVDLMLREGFRFI